MYPQGPPVLPGTLHLKKASSLFCAGGLNRVCYPHTNSVTPADAVSSDIRFPFYYENGFVIFILYACIKSESWIFFTHTERQSHFMENSEDSPNSVVK